MSATSLSYYESDATITNMAEKQMA